MTEKGDQARSQAKPTVSGLRKGCRNCVGKEGVVKRDVPEAFWRRCMQTF